MNVTDKYYNIIIVKMYENHVLLFIIDSMLRIQYNMLYF